jgi:hypothetical protein
VGFLYDVSVFPGDFTPPPLRRAACRRRSVDGSPHTLGGAKVLGGGDRSSSSSSGGEATASDGEGGGVQRRMRRRRRQRPTIERPLRLSLSILVVVVVVVVVFAVDPWRRHAAPMRRSIERSIDEPSSRTCGADNRSLYISIFAPLRSAWHGRLRRSSLAGTERGAFGFRHGARIGSIRRRRRRRRLECVAGGKRQAATLLGKHRATVDR